MSKKGLLKYRGAWLGCAMLWIVWYHSSLNLPVRLLTEIKGMGFGGVDIFLFASGLGCWFSLDKNPDAGSFLRRRFRRIAPTWLCFIVLWIAGKALCGDISVLPALGNLLGIQSITGLGGSFNWYISALILYYLLSPGLKAVSDMLCGWKQAFAVALLSIVSCCFWNSSLLIISVRMIVFFMGMLFARFCREDEPLTGRQTALMLACTAAGFAGLVLAQSRGAEYVWTHGVYWYPFILIVPGMCVLISLAAHAVSKWKIGEKLVGMLNVIGDYSFEIYLTHIALFDLANVLISKKILPGGRLVWLGALVCTAAAAFFLRRLTRLVFRGKND